MKDIFGFIIMVSFIASTAFMSVGWLKKKKGMFVISMLFVASLLLIISIITHNQNREREAEVVKNTPSDTITDTDEKPWEFENFSIEYSF